MTPGFGRKHPFLTVVVLVLGTAAARSQPSPPAPRAGTTVQDLAWLAGAWCTSGTPEVEEYWSRPKAGSMIGMGRTIVRGKTVETEFLRLEETIAGVDYVARPGGAGETRFKLVRVGEREAVFENPTHDFPKRLTYRLEADGGLWARIEGDGSEKEKPLEFRYERIEWAPR
jgi:hypothetical protein